MRALVSNTRDKIFWIEISMFGVSALRLRINNTKQPPFIHAPTRTYQKHHECVSVYARARMCCCLRLHKNITNEFFDLDQMERQATVLDKQKKHNDNNTENENIGGAILCVDTNLKSALKILTSSTSHHALGVIIIQCHACVFWSKRHSQTSTISAICLSMLNIVARALSWLLWFQQIYGVLYPLVAGYF